MLSFDIRDLDAHAAQVDGELAPNDPIWEEGDPLPAEPIHATGRLSTAGSGRYYWSGRIEGKVEGSCRRCLSAVRAPVSEEVHLIFSEAGDEGDDPDVFALSPDAPEVDLRPAIREQWLLAAPTFALCRDDCKGLCPRCGADLNEGPCDCPPDTDSRWEALKKAHQKS